MRNYWSCTKFADWLRGTPKLEYGTSDQWNEWRDRAHGYNPIRYWLAEEGLDLLQGFFLWIPDRLHDVKYYINNRWVTRTHALTAHPRDIPRGQWRDVGYRFLPCLFNELVEFVEVELAWHHVAWGDEEARAKHKPPFWASGWFRWRTWRSAEAGLDNLSWQMTLVKNEQYGLNPGDKGYGDPTPQARAAKEIYDLYTWWTYVYPKRPDPHDAGGWTAYCEKKSQLNNGRLFGGKTTKQLEKEGKKALALTQKIEEAYEKEDEAMMIRLIKVRNSLWT